MVSGSQKEIFKHYGISPSGLADIGPSVVAGASADPSAATLPAWFRPAHSIIK